MEENTEKRNLPLEVCMVVLGTFLIIISFISIKGVNLLLTDEQNEMIDNACKNLDKYGNYRADDINCFGDECYFAIDDSYIVSSCETSKAKVISKDVYDGVFDKSEEIKKYCNSIDEKGVYLNRNDDYCIDGVCFMKYRESYIRYQCPKVLVINDEKEIDDDKKSTLKELCKNYGDKSYQSDDEILRCNYGTCKIMDMETNGAYALRCSDGVFKLMNDDQTFDDDVTNKYLNMSCNNEEIKEERFNENIRCGNGICSIHYKQSDYFKVCNR